VRAVARQPHEQFTGRGGGGDQLCRVGQQLASRGHRGVRPSAEWGDRHSRHCWATARGLRAHSLSGLMLTRQELRPDVQCSALFLASIVQVLSVTGIWGYSRRTVGFVSRVRCAQGVAGGTWAERRVRLRTASRPPNVSLAGQRSLDRQIKVRGSAGRFGAPARLGRLVTGQRQGRACAGPAGRHCTACLPGSAGQGR